MDVPSVTVIWKQEAVQQQQTQIVTAGDAYASQSMFRLHFGLGEKAQIEQARIAWPSGRIQLLERPQVGIMHHIDEKDAEEVAR